MFVLMHPIVVSAEDNSFTADLARALRERGVSVDRFSWKRAFRGDYHVAHVHWPEALVRSSSVSRGLVKACAFLTLIHLNRLRGIRQIATVHNLSPHESLTRFQRWVIRVWYRTANERVYLSRAAAADGPVGSGVYIPHHMYSISSTSQYCAGPDVLTFGYLRRYKNLEHAIDSFADIEGRSLTILGKSTPPEYASELIARASDAPNVRVSEGSVPFEELERRIAEAACVLLPYQNLYSSGAALLALSVGTPVIVAESSSAGELHEDFGPEWVFVLPAGWAGAELCAAIDELDRKRVLRRGGRADAPARSLAAIAQQYFDVYAGIGASDVG